MPAQQGLLTGTPRQQGSTTNPYRGGLQTNFQDTTLHESFDGGDRTTYNTSLSSDPDVRQAQSLSNQLAHPNEGMDQGAMGAQLNMLKGRIGIKNSLGETIGANATQESNAEQNVKEQAHATLGQGLSNTRNNYNSRGLLYSGMREGGEQAVRGAVAGQMASGLAGTKQDYANSLSTAQNAYASVDLANQQDTLNRANQAFDTANQNTIARAQAMQQLGGGVGMAIGTIAGSRSSSTQPSSTGYYQTPQDVQNWMTSPNTGLLNTPLAPSLTSQGE